MQKLYLVECIYENEKQRIITLFSKDPYSNKYDFTFKEKFNPYIYIDLPKEVLQKILSDFKKEIKIETANNKKMTKIITKDKEILNKVYKIISMCTNKSPLLIDIERQYLIEKDWSYYDLFLIISSKKIKKIENNNVSSVVKKYITPFLKEEQYKIIEGLTRKVLLSNILKTKIKNIRHEEIMNTLFENLFFKNQIPLKNILKKEFIKKEIKIKDGLEIDFSNIWPYLLTNNFYNISFETIKCECCKPKNYFENNILLNSQVKVLFKKNGHYYISKDKSWAYEFHTNNENKENRLNFMKNNYLKEMPVGPFYNNDTTTIPLIDAIDLLKEDSIEIEKEQENLKWYCLKEESVLSKSIKEYLKRLKNIESSINLSTSIVYNNSFKDKNNFEKSPVFIQYLTEYKLINDLIEEMPKFIEHKNTKFYDPDLEKSIKYLKLQLIENITIEPTRFIIDKEKVIVKEKKFIEKINNYFPKINLPIPKLIVN